MDWLFHKNVSSSEESKSTDNESEDNNQGSESAASEENSSTGNADHQDGEQSDEENVGFESNKSDAEEDKNDEENVGAENSKSDDEENVDIESGNSDDEENSDTGSHKSDDDENSKNFDMETDDDVAYSIKIVEFVARGRELPSDCLQEMQEAAVNVDNPLMSLHAKYILCAHAAQHSSFIEPDYFGNLVDLLSTDNVTIRQSIMWAFASILPCKNILSPLLLRLLYRSLKDETLGWSISYLFRKMSEYDKYIPMITDAMWISMANTLFDETLSEKVRTTNVHTLSNIFRIRRWISPVIKFKFEQLVRTDHVPKRLFVATVHALHSMALTGATFDSETISKLRSTASVSDVSSMECIYDLVDFLDNKRILSNSASYMSGSHLKKELTATQNTTVSRSQEESTEPTSKFHSLNHLLGTVGNLDREFSKASEPTEVRSGHNQAWYRTTLQEVDNLASLARTGCLKDQDFTYLVNKFQDGLHWSMISWQSRESTFEIIAGAFRNAAKIGQAIPDNAIKGIIKRLTGSNSKIHRLCAECLLLVVKNQQSLSEQEIEQIELVLKETNDTEVKQHLIELYALYVSKGHHFKLDLESIERDLLGKKTSETASYIFFKAAAVEKRSFSKRISLTLSQIAMSNEYSIKVRDNCLWALAYYIKEMTDKSTISSELIHNFGEMLIDPIESIQQTVAIAICYYASDESTILSDCVLERLAVMLVHADYGLLSNVASVYLKMSKNRQDLPSEALKNIVHLLYHPEFCLRETAIWILKYAVDNGQDLTSEILSQVELCLDDTEFPIRNTAAIVFVNYWREQLTRNEKSSIRLLSDRMENFMKTVFQQCFSLKAQLLALDLLYRMVKKQCGLSESLFQILDCCLYDREKSISMKTIVILESYSKRSSLLKNTIVCLEHLLTTETPILSNVISILTTLVNHGHILSNKAVDVLAQLLFKSPEPQNITRLLTLADRNHPLPKNIDELLRQIYYSKILLYSTCSQSIAKATKELLNLTGQGKALAISVLNILFQKLTSFEQQQSLLPILVNVISNGQHLNSDKHRSVLEDIFRETIDEPSVDLMEIFTQLSRQNQALPMIVIEYLESFLSSEKLHYFAIEIYQHMIERQKPLGQYIVEKVFALFDEWEALGKQTQNRLIVFFKAIVENRPKDADQQYLPFLLEQKRIRKEICLIIKTLAEHSEKLSSETLNALIHLLDSEDDGDIQEIVLQTLDYARSNDSTMDKKLKKYLDFLQSDPEIDDKDFLKQLKSASKVALQISDTYLTRISGMLYSCDIDLKREAATILALIYPQEKNLSSKVLNTIYLTLLDDTINTKTIPLLLKHFIQCPTSVIDDLLYLASHSTHRSVKEYARQLLQTQEESNEKVREFFVYDQTLFEAKNSTSIEKMLISKKQDSLQQAIKTIRAKIIIEKQLSDKLQCSIANELIKHHDLLADLLLLAYNQGIQFHQNIHQAIENTFFMYQTTTMLSLVRILAEKGIVLQEKTLELLLNCSDMDNAVVTLEHAAQHQALPIKVISYLVEQLFKDSETMIQRHFSIIRRQILKEYIKKPMDLLANLRLPSIIDSNKLSGLDSFEQCLGTIQTLLFVNYFEAKVFDLPVKQWSRECLCIEILTSCSNTSMDLIVAFYQNLTEFERFKHYEIYNDQRDAFLSALIRQQRTNTLNLPTINQILIYAKTLTDRPLMILQSDTTDWLMQMRSYYIRDKLDERLPVFCYSTYVVDHLIESLAKQDQLPAELIESFLRTVRLPEHVIIFLDLMETYQITAKDLINLFANEKLIFEFDILRKRIELMILQRVLNSRWMGSREQLARTRTYLQKLLETGWTLIKTEGLLTSTQSEMKSTENLSYFLDVLKILLDYKVHESIMTNLKTILHDNEPRLWPSKAFAWIIEHHFGASSSEKNLEALLTEIKKVNEKINTTRLHRMFMKIKSAYKSISSILPIEKAIKNWNKSNIKNWAKEVRQSDCFNQPQLFEIIAVIKRAIYLDSNFEPRSIQILAILIVLDPKHHGGRLLQILTGEGKSTVVAMLAVIKALQDHHVDIITSSITLAKRDAHERESFYKMFNLTVAHNNDETSYVSGPKACYKADIVYGNSSQFQFDLLRHEFSLLNTRTVNMDPENKIVRQCDVVIIDEVDSMLIDENNTIARLADQLPGMEWLNPLLYGIWRAVNVDSNPLSKRDSIVEKIKNIVFGSDPQMKIPTHLNQFVFDSISTWIDNAIRAKIEYCLDHHYMIKPDETRTRRIVPIDYSNTGVVQASTTWSDGLHQFLQIKHGLRMTPLTVTTNYLSNIGLFTRYGEQIYGLTGTIGSKDAQKLLQQMYHVDTIIIPSFKQKRHIHLNTNLTLTDDEWLKTIVLDTLSNVRKRRAILIICETRLDAKTIAKQIQRADPTCLIRMYTDNTDAVESNAVGTRIQQGEVIVATNLAGRGTDLKTSPEVEKQGGLHVCLTFLPNNLRVEEQAFGRTSRQGQRGTSQMIFSRDRTLRQLIASFPNYVNDRLDQCLDPIELIRDWRSQAERAHLDRIWNEEILDIRLKDTLFENFCQLLSELRDKKDDAYKLLSVKEQWGLWLKSMDTSIQNTSALKQLVERQGFNIEDMPHDGYSFFHAISHQLNGNFTAEQIKDQVIAYMMKNPESYKDINDEKRHVATSEALNISIIVLRSDYNVPQVHERKDAEYTCLIGYEVDSHYVSLKMINSDTISTDETKTNVKIKNSKSQRMFQKFKNFVDTSADEKKKFETALLTRILDPDLETGFKTFAEQITANYLTDDIIQNPSYFILEADTIIEKLSKWANRAHAWVDSLPFVGKAATYKDAVDRLERAVEIDPIFTFSAWINQAYFLIDNGEDVRSYKTTAKSYLIRAQEHLNNHVLAPLHSMQLEIKKAQNDLLYEDLAHQTQVKVEILQMYQNYLTQAITTIEDSQKLIDVTATDGDQVNISRKLYRDEVQEIIEESTGIIELGFHNLTVYNDVIKHDQALKLLTLVSKHEECVSIHFLNGACERLDKVKSTTSLSTISLNIQYLDANEIPELIKIANANLTLTASVEDYINVIKAVNLYVTILTDSNRLRLSPSDAIKYINESKRIESILFESITEKTLKVIGEQAAQVSFALTFQSLPISRTNDIVKLVSKPFSFEFQNLTVSEAYELINKTTERNFILTVHNLTVDRATKIIKKFDRNEQNITASLKHIKELFTKADESHEELNVYAIIGITQLIIIDELAPRPWISVGIVITLGVGQIVGGIALAAVTGGLGVTFGISLIAEGVSDIYFGVRGALSRRFSWKDYAIQKGISLAICFASLGFSAVRHAAKGAKEVATVGTTAFWKGTGQGTIELVKNSGKIVGTGAIQGISKTTWTLACKQVAVTSMETGTRELANYLCDVSYDEVISVVKCSIREEIERITRVEQENEQYQRVFNRALTVDTYYGKDEWQQNMEQTAMKILMKQKNKSVEAMTSVSVGISKAFLNHSRQFIRDTADSGVTGKYGRYVELGHRFLTVMPVLKGSHELVTVTNSFFSSYRSELTLLEKKIPIFEDLLIHASNQNLSIQDVTSITQLLVKNNILTENGNLNPRFIEQQEQCNFIGNDASFMRSSGSLPRTPKDRLLNETRTIFDSPAHRDGAETVLVKLVDVHRTSLRISMFQKKVIDMLVDQICMIIYGTLVTPLTNYVISKSIMSLSETIQNQLDPKGTIANQLMEHGAKRYINIIANNWFRQIENEEIELDPTAEEKLDQFQAECQNDDKKPKNAIEKLALEVKNGKPGSVIELCVLAFLTKKPIIVAQQQLDNQANKDDESISVIYTPPTVDTTTGQEIDSHYESSGGTTATGNVQDCLYTSVLSNTSGMFQSVDDMRNKCAAFIYSNPNFIVGILPAIDIINGNPNPQRRKELMMEGASIFNSPGFRAKMDAFSLTIKNLAKQNADQIATLVTVFLTSQSPHVDIGIEALALICPQFEILKSAGFVLDRIRLHKVAANISNIDGSAASIVQTLFDTGALGLSLFCSYQGENHVAAQREFNEALESANAFQKEPATQNYQQNLSKHYEKHGTELGVTSVEEMVQLAEGIRADPNVQMIFTCENKHFIYVPEKPYVLITGANDGFVTLFQLKNKTPEDYYNKSSRYPTPGDEVDRKPTNPLGVRPGTPSVPDQPTPPGQFIPVAATASRIGNLAVKVINLLYPSNPSV